MLKKKVRNAENAENERRMETEGKERQNVRNRVMSWVWLGEEKKRKREKNE